MCKKKFKKNKKQEQILPNLNKNGGPFFIQITMYRQLASVALMGLDNVLSGNEKDMIPKKRIVCWI